MNCFELLYNAQRFIASMFGKKLVSLDAFYSQTLSQRRFMEYTKSLSPKERLAFILMQDKKMFEAWKNLKNLRIQNFFLLLSCVFCLLFIYSR